MAISPSARQRRYRERHLKEGNAERLNMVVDVSAKRALERLARHRGTSQRAVVEAIVAQAERETVGAIEDQAGYYGDSLRSNRSSRHGGSSRQ